MPTFIRNMESEKGRAFWKSVDNTAEKVPESIKKRIMNAPIYSSGEKFKVHISILQCPLYRKLTAD